MATSKGKPVAGLTIRKLKRIHREKREEILARLAEFEDVGNTASNEKLFEELVFCIFTAAASARMGLRSVESLRPDLRRRALHTKDPHKGHERLPLLHPRWQLLLIAFQPIRNRAHGG